MGVNDDPIKTEEGKISAEDLAEVEQIRRQTQLEALAKIRREELKKNILANEAVEVNIGGKQFHLRAKSWNMTKHIVKQAVKLFDVSSILNVKDDDKKNILDLAYEEIDRKEDDFLLLLITLFKDKPEDKITKQEINWFREHCGPANADLIIAEFLYLNRIPELLKNVVSLRGLM